MQLKKENKASRMLMMDMVFCCGISLSMAPIAHVFPLMATGCAQTAAGIFITSTASMTSGIPMALLTVGAMLFIFRFALRLNLSGTRTVDPTSKKKTGPCHFYVCGGAANFIQPVKAAFICLF